MADEIREWFENNVGTLQATDAGSGAVFAMLDLHGPEESNGKLFCRQCLDVYGIPQSYPCRTVRAITAAVRKQDPMFKLRAQS